MDAHHQLCVLGHRHADVVDHLDNLLPEADGTRTLAKRGHRFGLASRGASGCGIIFVSAPLHLKRCARWETDVQQDHPAWQASKGYISAHQGAATRSYCRRDF